MKSVVLSTTGAEYMAHSKVVKELKFIVQLLQTMNITVELPITVHVDNVGATWLSNNRNTGDRTKHIDIRTSFVKEYQEDGKIIISIPYVEAVLASLVVESLSNCKFSIISNFCLIVDSSFYPSRALTRSFESFTPLTWTFFCSCKFVGSL